MSLIIGSILQSEIVLGQSIAMIVYLITPYLNVKNVLYIFDSIIGLKQSYLYINQSNTLLNVYYQCSKLAQQL
jgi:hypothetical protein